MKRLKKAEQERAAAQGRPAPAQLGDAGGRSRRVRRKRPRYQRRRGRRSRPVASAMPAFASPFSLDALLARCPQIAVEAR